VKPLVLFSPWFGPWPAWTDLYLVSCAANREVRWVIPTDQPLPENRPGNVDFLPMTLGEFAERVSTATGARFAPTEAYKLCDIKPMLGHAFEAETVGYRSWGYSDMDVVFGDIRRFYDDDLLERYAAISTHANFLSGHLAVFKNNEQTRLAYRRRRRRWREAIAAPDYVQFDEMRFSAVFKPGRPLHHLIAIRPSLFVERYSTVGGHTWIDGTKNFPDVWTWKDGALRTTVSGEREFLYLHFMFWRRRRRSTPEQPAPWETLSHPLVQIDWRAAGTNGFVISPSGFDPLLPDADLGTATTLWA